MAERELFLSYHTPDREAVQMLRQALQARGIETFLDREDLVPGRPWPQALEQALDGVDGVAVFIGRHGLGLWQKREMWFALDRQAREEGEGRDFPVIPVLLPGADPVTGFLFLNTWVDLRDDLEDRDSLTALVRAVRGVSPVPPIAEHAAPCPYRGLQPFLEEHASLFFGREAFSNRLLDEVLAKPLVAVIGPSGSGKSSVVHAGLLPLLRKRRAPEATWDAVSFRPGDRPFHNLARGLIPLLEPDLHETKRLVEARALGDALANGSALLEDAVHRLLERSAGTDRVLIVVDQFEELFTQTPERNQKPFVDALLAALAQAPLRLVPTLRADFYAQAIQVSRDLSDVLEGGVVNLGPMRREELERVIVEPARRVSLSFEPGLVGRMLEDVGGEPGNLPLLEFALTELWARRAEARLLHAAYEDIGEVSGAIAKRAEREYERLPQAQKELARRVFKHLVRVASPAQWSEDTRRRATRSELGSDAAAVVELLAKARLLVAGSRDELSTETEGEETIELAHEALIRHWSRLRTWLDADREFLLWQQRLHFSLTEWTRTERDPGALLRGASLSEAEHWRGERGQDLAADDARFIESSTAAHRAEVEAQRRRRRRGIAALATGGLLALLLAGLAGTGWWQATRESMARKQAEQHAMAERDAAREAARISSSREFAIRADSQLDVDPERSLLLAMEAMRIAPTVEAKDALVRALLQSHVRVVLRGHSGEVNDVAVNLDATHIATAGHDGTVRLWNARNGNQIKFIENDGGPVLSVAYDPQGMRIVSAGRDGIARVLDAGTGNVILILAGHDGEIRSARFGADGRHVVTGGVDETVRIWDANSGAQLLMIKDRATVQSVQLSPNGKYLLTAGRHTARVWDVDEKRLLVELRGHQYNVYEASFSPDGQLVATAGEDGTARVWRWRSDATPLKVLEHTGGVHSVTFSPDGHWLATGTRSPDNVTHLWDLDSGKRMVDFRGHSDAIDAIAFTGDGRRVISASQDGTVRIWQHHLLLLSGHTGEVNTVAYSPDGTLLVSGDRHGVIRVWDAASGVTRTRFGTRPGWVETAVYSPDGDRMVIAASAAPDDNAARIVDATTGVRKHTLRGHAGYLVDAAFSPDGTRVVTASEDGTARVWSADTGRNLVTLRGHRAPLRAATFSPDGDRILTASLDATARVWDAASGTLLLTLNGHESGVSDATFSPIGEHIATAGLDETVRIWDAANGAALHVLHGHTDAVWSVEFDRNGKCLLSAGDRTARIWSVERGRSVAILSGHLARVVDAAFSPDGRHVATASWDKTLRVQPFDLCRSEQELLSLARTRVTRELGPEDGATPLE